MKRKTFIPKQSKIVYFAKCSCHSYTTSDLSHHAMRNRCIKHLRECKGSISQYRNYKPNGYIVHHDYYLTNASSFPTRPHFIDIPLALAEEDNDFMVRVHSVEGETFPYFQLRCEWGFRRCYPFLE